MQCLASHLCVCRGLRQIYLLFSDPFAGTGVLTSWVCRRQTIRKEATSEVPVVGSPVPEYEVEEEEEEEDEEEARMRKKKRLLAVALPPADKGILMRPSYRPWLPAAFTLLMTHESTPAGTLRLRCIPARPYHHSPHTLERPPHAGLFPASRPGQMATQCVAASGRGSRHTPEGSPPPDHCHAPRPLPRPTHPRAPPTCWRLPCFTARPDGYSGCGGCHTPEGSPPPDHCQYHSPVVQYHSSISPPFSRSPPWSPDGGRRASLTGWRSPCYQHHHHHHYTAPPRDRWSPQRSPRRVTRSLLPSPRGAAHHPQTAVPPRSGAAHHPAAPHATPRAIPIPGGLRSPCRSLSPLGEVYPYERRGWGCAAREWEALTTTITAPRQSREIGRLVRGDSVLSLPSPLFLTLPLLITLTQVY
ncbi:uncharacterized protein LOC135099570 isoform X2 [Scylla paramamosain]|uniref:uncharacterized protein LOC135099570 isoform X2 n=1 Tax=Scylla paramamosain TaxID=85552 RepID=UPI0030829F18